jgi:hypothetical protein
LRTLFVQLAIARFSFFAIVRGPFLLIRIATHLANIALTQATLLASGVTIQGRTQLAGLKKTHEILLGKGQTALQSRFARLGNFFPL